MFEIIIFCNNGQNKNDIYSIIKQVLINSLFHYVTLKRNQKVLKIIYTHIKTTLIHYQD